MGEGSDHEIAQELERAALKALVVDKCHECKLGKEVNTHQEMTIRQKESKIKSMAIRLKKTDEKKNELHKEKNKMGVENKQLKSELKKCQDMLAESRKKVSTLTYAQLTRTVFTHTQLTHTIFTHTILKSSRKNHPPSLTPTLIRVRVPPSLCSDFIVMFNSKSIQFFCC